jgi:hypothetical protein
MGATTGLAPLNDYTGLTSDAALALLLASIPNPDVSPAQAGGVKLGSGGFLDEMSPGAAAQLRVEIQSIITLTA